MYVCMYVCMYIHRAHYVYVCTYIYIYIYIYKALGSAKRVFELIDRRPADGLNIAEGASPPPEAERLGYHSWCGLTITSTNYISIFTRSKETHLNWEGANH